MVIVIYALLVVIGLLALITVIHLVAMLKVVGRLMDTNRRLILLTAGKEPKPESSLRALVSLDKPPRGKLKGIADGKKDRKPANTDYTIAIGT